MPAFKGCGVGTAFRAVFAAMRVLKRRGGGAARRTGLSIIGEVMLLLWWLVVDTISCTGLSFSGDAVVALKPRLAETTGGEL